MCWKNKSDTNRCGALILKFDDGGLCGGKWISPGEITRLCKDDFIASGMFWLKLLWANIIGIARPDGPLSLSNLFPQKTQLKSCNCYPWDDGGGGSYSINTEVDFACLFSSVCPLIMLPSWPCVILQHSPVW